MRLLEVSGIDSYYGDSHILFDLSLEVAPGEVVCLLGRNGAGKTTTLKSIIGLVPPRSGQITLRGRSLTGLAPFRIARLGIGYVPEERRIFGNLTIRENLEVARRTWGDGAGEPWTADRVFDLFPHLRTLRDRPAGRLHHPHLGLLPRDVGHARHGRSRARPSRTCPRARSRRARAR